MGALGGGVQVRVACPWRIRVCTLPKSNLGRSNSDRSIVRRRYKAASWLKGGDGMLWRGRRSRTEGERTGEGCLWRRTV